MKFLSEEQRTELIRRHRTERDRRVAEYQEKMKIKPENGGSESKLGKEQTEELVSHLKSVVYTKVSEICECVRERFGESYSVAGMTSWLKAQGFVYKKLKGVPVKMDAEKQAEFVKKYEELKEKVADNEPIVFMDSVIRQWRRR